MTRTGWFLLILALLVAAAFCVYTIVDQAVTIDHHASEVRRQAANAELLASLLTTYSHGAPIDTVLPLLRRQYPERIVKRAGDTIEIDGISLQFRDGRLERVAVLR
jgi:hypothetical protein